MIYSQAEFMKLILDTHAVKIWNRQSGPVFWYAASVPGPFYVNTEYMLGATLAEKLLADITQIVAETPDSATRAAKLNALILGACANDAGYARLIETMAAKTKESFGTSFTALSGGERRDWLFSIPLAQHLGIKHIFFFKNGAVHCDTPLAPNEATLHVSDLINNAASYFDLWLPAMTKANLNGVGTVSVNSRGTNGVKRLTDHGVKVVTMNSIDITFFEQLAAHNLIDAATLEEIRVYFGSAQEWAARYLLTGEDKEPLYGLATLDAKSRERLVTFFTKDPWGLKARNPAFFDKMAAAGQKAA